VRRPAALPVLAALAVGSFVFAVVGSVLAPEPPVESAAANSFSRSAIGHRALVETLRRDGVPVVVSRWNSGRRAGEGAVLLVAEPDLSGDGAARMEQMLREARRAIVVLPKWTGRERDDKPGWVSQVSNVGHSARHEVLRAAAVDAEMMVLPGQADAACAGLPSPRVLGLQLFRPDAQAVVACGPGALAIERTRGGSRVVVVSDPDILANHGLGKPGHARLARAVIDQVLRPGETLVVDETLHGFQHPPSVWRDLFRWPLVAGLVQAVAAVLCLVAAGLPRFGRVLPDEPAIAPGKEVLVRNTSDLLAEGGHHGWLLRRYVEVARRDVTAALRGPAGAGPAAVRAFLAEAERRRNVPSLAAVEAQAAALPARAAPGPALRLAARTHRWKEEMTRGARRRP
jgi:hypothetical protein